MSSRRKFPAVYVCQNYENWLRVDQVIAVITVCCFLAYPVQEQARVA